MNLVEFGNNLKKARLKLGLTQVEVAEKAGLSPNYYARLERGDANPTLETAESIFTTLHIKSSEILSF